MTHHEVLLIDAYLDDEMSAAEKLTLEGHLADCEQCRVQLEAGLVLRATLSHAGALPRLRGFDELWPIIEPRLEPRGHGLGIAGWASGGALAVFVLVAQSALLVLLMVSVAGMLGIPVSDWLAPVGELAPDSSVWSGSPRLLDRNLLQGVAGPPIVLAVSSFSTWLFVTALALSFFGWVLAARRRHLLGAGVPAALHSRAGAHN